MPTRALLRSVKTFSLVTLTAVITLVAASCSSDEGDDSGGADMTAPADITAPEDFTAPEDAAASDVIASVDVGDDDAGSSAQDTGGPRGPVCVDDLCVADHDHAPNPEEWGPFPVGVRTVTYIDEAHPNAGGSPRTLRTEIWYPTTEDFRDATPTSYDLVTDAPADMVDMFAGLSMDPLPSAAIRDAAMRRGDGPYPLVLFSHGAYGVRFQDVFLTEKLASHGYIVISPDHELNTTWDYLRIGWDLLDLVISASHRLKDGPFLIDTMIAANDDPEDPLYGQIDTDDIGLMGHSFGGFLAVHMKGSDDRIKVVVPMAPAAAQASAITGTNLSTTHKPTLMMGGDLDNTLSFQDEMWTPYGNIPEPKAFLRFYRGGHYTFTDMCRLDVVQLAEDLGWGDAEDALHDGCGAENFDPATARAIVTYYTIAMFNTYLRHSPGSRDYLTATRVSDYPGEVEFYDDLGDWPID